MITEFVNSFEEHKATIRARFAARHPDSYEEIVKIVLAALNPHSAYGKPDPDKVHCIDDGHYQGTLVYVIPETGYQPSDYWYVKVSYGSCSGCDTLKGIRSYEDTPPSESQINDYMTLALHVVQGLKKMGE